MQRSRSAFVASALLLLTVGCGSTSPSATTQTNSPTTPEDAAADASAIGLPADGGTDAPDSAKQGCTAIANSGADVLAHTVGSAPPTATGGAIVDGTYRLSDLSVYTGSGVSSPLPLTIRSTLVVHGATVDIVQDAVQTSGTTHEWSLETFAASGATVCSWRRRC